MHELETHVPDAKNLCYIASLNNPDSIGLLIILSVSATHSLNVDKIDISSGGKNSLRGWGDRQRLRGGRGREQGQTSAVRGWG